jgi:DNA-directed RNA polymerase specialized sigma24 family protein
MQVDISDERMASVAGIARGMSRGRCADEGEVLGEAFLALVEADAAGLGPEKAEIQVRRKCRNALRRQWREESRTSSPGRDIAEPDYTELREAIKSLPSRQCCAIELHFLEGLEYSEVAAEMSCTEKAAENLGCRALANLQKILSGKRGLLTSTLRKASEDGNIPVVGASRH